MACVGVDIPEGDSNLLALVRPLDSTPPPDMPAGAGSSVAPLPEFGAFGDGCSNADTTLSVAGLTFTTTFQRYALELGSRETYATRSCTISPPIANGAKTYALASVTFTAEASLDAASHAELVADVTLAGASLRTSEGEPAVTVSALTGPRGGDLVVAESYPESALAFLPCGPSAQPRIRTTAILQDLAAGGTGKVRIKSARFEFVERSCDP